MTRPAEPLSVRIPEACRMTGIGRSKLYELIAEGEIHIVKVGTITLVPVRSLRSFLARREAAAAPGESRPTHF
jgi:excisionase family DNA binding protein